MRKLLLLLTLGWFVMSCSVNVTDQEFAGTYTTEVTEHIYEDSQTNAMDISLSATTNYRINHTSAINGEMSFGVEVNEDGYQNYITLIFDISAIGSWELTDGNQLVEQYSIDAVSIEYRDMKLKTMDEQGAIAAAYLVSNIGSEIEALRQEIAAGATYKIVSFNSSGMKIEDEQGVCVEYTRADTSPLEQLVGRSFNPDILSKALGVQVNYVSGTAAYINGDGRCGVTQFNYEPNMVLITFDKCLIGNIEDKTLVDYLQIDLSTLKPDMYVGIKTDVTGNALIMLYNALEYTEDFKDCLMISYKTYKVWTIDENTNTFIEIPTTGLVYQTEVWD